MKMQRQSHTNLHPRNALPSPEDLYVNIPSGSGGAIQVGVKTDVRKKLYLNGKEGTEIEGAHYSAVDLGGTYVGSQKVAGFTYDKNEYTVVIDASYVAGSGHIGMLLPPPYNSSFPSDDNSWTVGKMS